jgi:hypothetical protein
VKAINVQANVACVGDNMTDLKTLIEESKKVSDAYIKVGEPNLKLVSVEWDKALRTIQVLVAKVEEIKTFWTDIDTPKPYFIGDKCDEALEQAAEIMGGGK